MNRAILLGAILVLSSGPALAIGKREIPVSYAENGLKLDVSHGYALVLNFTKLKNKIATAWLSDLTELTVNSNTGTCDRGNCSGGSILYLKAIDPIHFPGLPRAQDRASLLTVALDNGDVMQFRLSVKRSVPTYTHISLTPEVPKPLPFGVSSSKPFDGRSVSRFEPRTPAPFQPRQVYPERTLHKGNDVSQTLSDPPLLAVAPPLPPPVILFPAEPKNEKSVNSVITQKVNVNAKPQATVKSQSPQSKDSVNAVRPRESNTLFPGLSNQDLASALRRGIHTKDAEQQIGKGIHYATAQDLMLNLQKDENLSLEDAIKLVRMDRDVAINLIKFGLK